ncbi:hypothetical protein RCL1_008687 [Eukaryota sp. TZLM3-RCL]
MNVSSSIENLLLDILTSIASGTSPTLSIPKNDLNTEFSSLLGHYVLRDDSDFAFKTVSLSKRSGIHKFDVLMRTLSFVYDLLQNKKHASKRYFVLSTTTHNRELFYGDPDLYKDQRVSDEAIMDISRLLRVPRDHLNVFAEAKGIVAGDLVLWNGQTAVNCATSTFGLPILPFTKNISDLRSEGLKWIIVVEKDAALYRLLEDDIRSKIGPCILITGCGFPDFATRSFLNIVAQTFSTVPVVGLVDADPYGLDILCTYRFGNAASAFETDLCVPRIKWLGVTAQDIASYDVSESALLPLTAADKKRGTNMIQRDCWDAAPQWKEQLEIMIDSGFKAEIQALMSIDMEFLVNTYIPHKLENRLFI